MREYVYKRYIYIIVHAHVHCTQQCITFIHNHVSFNGSMRERERGEIMREYVYKRYIYIIVHAHVHCTQQCITFIHNHVSFNGSMSKLTRLQRHVTTWESAWLQGLGCEAPAIQHNQARPLGALSPGSSEQLDEGSGIPNLHSALAAASPQCSGDEADE